MQFFRRRHFLINKKIQLKYVFLTVLLLVSYTIILLAAIFAPYVITIFSEIPVSQKAAAAEVILILHSNIWPWVGALITLCGIYSIFITHKMAGPIFVLSRMASEVSSGNLTVRARLRKGDDLVEVADSFNKIVDEMESMLTMLDREDKKLSTYITALERELASRDVPEDEFLMLEKEMEAAKAGIKDILSRYKYRTED